MSCDKQSVKELNNLLHNTKFTARNNALRYYYWTGLASSDISSAYGQIKESSIIPTDEALAVALIVCDRKMNGRELFTQFEDTSWLPGHENWNTFSDYEFLYFLTHVDEYYAKIQHFRINQYNEAIQLIDATRI